MTLLMKKILGLLFLVLVGLAQSSCFREPEIVYNGPTVIEFNSAIVANAPDATPVFSVPNGVGAIFERVNLVGPQRNTDVTLRFRVDPTRTTAIEGTHYDLNGGTFVLPANRSFTELSFRVLNAPPSPTLPNGSSVDVVLELEGNEEIRASQNYRFLVFRILL